MKVLIVLVLASLIYISQGRPQNETKHDEEDLSSQDEYSIALSDWIAELIENVSNMIHSFMTPLTSELEYAYHVIDEQDHYINMLEDHLGHKDESEENCAEVEQSIDDVPPKDYQKDAIATDTDAEVQQPIDDVPPKDYQKDAIATDTVAEVEQPIEDVPTKNDESDVIPKYTVVGV